MLRLYCNCCNSPANNPQLEAEKERVGDIDVRQWKTEWQRGRDRRYHLRTHTPHTCMSRRSFLLYCTRHLQWLQSWDGRNRYEKKREKSRVNESECPQQRTSLLFSHPVVWIFSELLAGSSDKFQPEMDPSLPCRSQECPAYEADEGENGLRETRWLTQWDSWTSSRGGERARALGLIPSGCPGPHARGYRSRIGTTSPNQRLQSRSRPSCLGH